MTRFLVLGFIAVVLAPVAAQPGARPAIPVSLLRIGDEYYAPTPARRLTAGESVHAFAFSPDGNYLAFLTLAPTPRDADPETTIDDPLASIDEFSRGHVGLVDIRSGATRRVLDLPIREGTVRGMVTEMAQAFAFSPDGRWLAVPLEFFDFAPPTDVGPERQGSRLAVIAVADGAMQWARGVMTSLGVPVRTNEFSSEVHSQPAFAWHPTRPILVYSQQDGDEFYLIAWHLEQGQRERLGNGIAPQWNRDGSALGFYKYEKFPQTLQSRSEDAETRQINALSFAPDEIALPGLAGQPAPRPRPAADGERWQVVTAAPQFGQEARPLVVRDADTQRETVVARPGPGRQPRALEWSADGRLLLYGTTFEITDPLRTRAKGYLVQYWVYNAADATPDCTAFIAADTWHTPEDNMRGAMQMTGPTFQPAAWGPRGYDIAVIRDSDLWLTSLAPAGFLGTPTTSLGMPEMEAIQQALRRVMAVGQAARRYAEEHDGLLPDPAVFDEALRPYLDDPSVLYLPNQPGVLGITWLVPAGFNLNAVPPEDAYGIPIAAMFWPPGFVAAVFPGGAARYFSIQDWDARGQ